MSVLKENKCLACPQNQREDPCEAEQFIDRKTAENREQGLQQADKKKSDYLTKYCLLLVGGLKRTQLLIFMGLYRVYFTFCTNVF